MSKIEFLRRMLLGCFTVTTAPTTSATVTTAAATTTTTTKKRLSTSLRDDILFDIYKTHDSFDDDDDDDDNDNNIVISEMAAPPRASKSMVICTFFGQRGGSQSQSHVWFCVQLNRLSPKPSLLLELSLSTRSLVQEMRSGLLRIALECSSLEFSSCPLHQVPVWSAFCNGRRVGFAARRKPNQETREMLKKMESITVGAGVIQEFMYMRANYEWVVGGANSQSFHLISPDDGPAQELSVFLLRSSSSSSVS